MTAMHLRISLAVGLFVVGAAAGWGAAQAQDDAREAIIVTPAQRTMTLAEMRGLLASVNGVLRGAATGDTALMRASAAAGGMEAMRQQHRAARPGGAAMPAMGTPMPPAFRALGHGTHAGFDSLATAIAAGADQQLVVGKLAALTTNCVNCHAAFRLEVR